jgi:hypothetical protein
MINSDGGFDEDDDDQCLPLTNVSSNILEKVGEE